MWIQTLSSRHSINEFVCSLVFIPVLHMEPQFLPLTKVNNNGIHGKCMRGHDV